MMINVFGFFYFSNLMNGFFAEFPIVGAVLGVQLGPPESVSYKSEYGKTKGLLEPSEGSLIFRKWFGGEHPSQTRSCRVLPGKRQHMISTIKSIFGLAGKPVLTKNAWNCFRIRELAEVFPNIHFVWIRRDIGLSALSDLEARYRRGSATVWNSATTANYQEIQKKAYWEQVVEQQYYYNRSIAFDLRRFDSERHIELWYEDMCDDPERELHRINAYLVSKRIPCERKTTVVPPLTGSSKKMKLAEDYGKICNYIGNNIDRLSAHIHPNFLNVY
jgi:hypothetical protein